jgi:hypothetical protein
LGWIGRVSKRFRPLETDTETETATDDVPEQVPVFVGE